MNAPSITPAQILAALGAVLGLLVSFGVLDSESSQAIGAAASTLIPFGLLIADAVIRQGRAKAIGNGAIVVDSKLINPNQP